MTKRKIKSVDEEDKNQKGEKREERQREYNCFFPPVKPRVHISRTA